MFSRLWMNFVHCAISVTEIQKDSDRHAFVVLQMHFCSLKQSFAIFMSEKDDTINQQ